MSASIVLHGLDEERVLFLERHETRSHAVGDRVLRDLGDCLVLHSPEERDPFMNRIGAIRWPADPNAFDARLAELLALFAGLDRRPHVWSPPAYRRPADLEARLVDHGFRRCGAAYLMLAVRPPTDEARPPVTLPPGMGIERRSGGRPAPAGWVTEVAGVLRRSFGLDEADAAGIEADLRRSLTSPAVEIAVVRVEGEVVSVGKRATFDGASYLSSIATLPGRQGRGYGTLLAATLRADSLVAGSRWTYLAVHVANDRALEVYRRCGFEILGEPAGDLLLG